MSGAAATERDRHIRHGLLWLGRHLESNLKTIITPGLEVVGAAAEARAEAAAATEAAAALCRLG